MDLNKIGKTIKKLRIDKGLRQIDLAEKLNLSDGAVSKWERGLGLPDISILKHLSQILECDIETIIDGEIIENNLTSGNLKKLNIYYCPICQNIITTLNTLSCLCCGKKLESIVMEKASNEEKLNVEIIDNEWVISKDLEMVKINFVTALIFITGDKIIINKLFPEWEFRVRLYRYGLHGKLVWLTNHGICKYQLI